MDKKFSRQERRLAYSLNQSLLWIVNEEGMERTFGERVKPTVKNINEVLVPAYSGDNTGLRKHLGIPKYKIIRVYQEFFDLVSQQSNNPNHNSCN